MRIRIFWGLYWGLLVQGNYHLAALHMRIGELVSNPLAYHTFGFRV